MTHPDLSISLVRQSIRLLGRAQTHRTCVAIQRRELSSSTACILTSHQRLHHPQRATHAQIRWLSSKQDPPRDEQTQALSAVDRIQDPDLVSEVKLQPDPNGVLPDDHPALSVLGQSSLIISRQIEMMNMFIGFEQANKYTIMNGEKEVIGYIAETDHGIGQAIVRQMVRVHRSFTAHVFDKDQKEVLRIHRPFSFINTRIRIYDPVARSSHGYSEINGASETGQVSPMKLEDMPIIGECQSQWTPTRRKYHLSTYRTSDHDAATLDLAGENKMEAQMTRFSSIDEPALSWDFTIKDIDNWVIGKVTKSFQGVAREIFTDTGVYALKMDSAAHTAALEDAQGKELSRYEVPGMTSDQRAVMIATAVSIDFDYFSIMSSKLNSAMPMAYMMGTGAAEGGAVAEAGAGAVGAAGRTAAGAGAMEGGLAGAGTIAGYEAMQRGVYGDQNVDDANPQAAPTSSDPSSEPIPGSGDQPGEDVWSTGQDPWSEASNATEGGGSSWLDTITDWFSGD